MDYIQQIKKKRLQSHILTLLSFISKTIKCVEGKYYFSETKKQFSNPKYMYNKRLFQSQWIQKSQKVGLPPWIQYDNIMWEHEILRNNNTEPQCEFSSLLARSFSMTNFGCTDSLKSIAQL